MVEIGPRIGGCLCGAARFTATPMSDHVDACHCGMCRRWSGGVFMAIQACPVVVDDESALGVYKSSEYGERVFCKTCGSSLFWRMQDGSATAVSLQAFDDASGLVFAEEIFIDEKPAIYDFANDTRKLTGQQFVERWAAQDPAAAEGIE